MDDQEARLLTARPLHLELGCGRRKRRADSLGIDILKLDGVDIVGDALDVLSTLPDSSVASIFSTHFLEHVDDPLAILRGSARVLQSGGEFRAVVPHFSNPAFYSDPTHKAFFGLYTFAYWVRAASFRRKVPQYIDPLPFELLHARYRFKSSPPFYVRHAIKKLLSSWVNQTRWTQEFYEEHLCWILPCWEIEFLLRRDPAPGP